MGALKDADGSGDSDVMDVDVEAPGLRLVLGRVVRMRWFNFVPLSESLSSVLSYRLPLVQHFPYHNFT